jgi:hypothetical protein
VAAVPQPGRFDGFADATTGAQLNPFFAPHGLPRAAAE